MNTKNHMKDNIDFYSGINFSYSIPLTYFYCIDELL